MSLLQEVKAYLALIMAQVGIEIDPDDKIVTAVSGGPDSLTLLHLLTQRGLHPAENVIVAHLDHQLRPSSAEEAEKVCRIAAEWGAPCRIKRVDVNVLAQQLGFSVEEAGRHARYRFFFEIAAEFNAHVIFTGHHAGDQVETVLMHLLRGSGSAGLRGMLPVSSLAFPIVRPLLATSRAEIEAYCQRHQLSPLIDESNTDTTFFRNRLRHELLPYLERYNPRIRDRLWAMASVTAADYDWLQQQTAEALTAIHLKTGAGWIRLDLAGWQQLPLSLRRSTLRWAVARIRPTLRDVGFQTIEQARRVAEKGVVGTVATLPGRMSLRVGYDDLLLIFEEVESPPSQLPQLTADEPVPLPIPGRLSLANGRTLTSEWVSDIDIEMAVRNDDPWIAYLDIGETETLVVRPRLPGERFQPLGMDGHTKSVKDVMIDRKIPAESRPRWPIVAGEHLLWIVLYDIDERVKVHPGSERVVKLALEKASV